VVPADTPPPGTYALDPEHTTIGFGVTKKKGMVGRTADLVIDAVARPASTGPA